MNSIKNLNVYGWIFVASSVAALVGLIIYIVSGTTGFMAGQVIGAWPIVLTIFAILGVLAIAYFEDKLDNKITGGLIFIVLILLTISFCLFIFSRIQLFSDVYFIPVNHPTSEDASLNASIVGFVFYIIAIVCTIVAGFVGGLHKQAK